MLDVLRASKGGIITWFFLGAIIVVFVISFGPGSFAEGQSRMRRGAHLCREGERHDHPAAGCTSASSSRPPISTGLSTVTSSST